MLADIAITSLTKFLFKGYDALFEIMGHHLNSNHQLLYFLKYGILSPNYHNDAVTYIINTSCRDSAFDVSCDIEQCSRSRYIYSVLLFILCSDNRRGTHENSSWLYSVCMTHYQFCFSAHITVWSWSTTLLLFHWNRYLLLLYWYCLFSIDK